MPDNSGPTTRPAPHFYAVLALALALAAPCVALAVLSRFALNEGDRYLVVVGLVIVLGIVVVHADDILWPKILREAKSFSPEEEILRGVSAGLMKTDDAVRLLTAIHREAPASVQDTAPEQQTAPVVSA